MGNPSFHSVTEEWIENSVRQYINHPAVPIPQGIYNYVSPLRKLLFEWYPFFEGCRILEVGGNMGELTGLFCDKGGSVVSIEKNETRADIIRFRCKKYKNIEVKSIPFQDISLLGKFDYIVVHNTFGLLKKYFLTPNPYVDFLKLLYNSLSSEGKILIAVNNRIGMQYLSGAVEELTKKRYTGINNFDGYDQVRTFSKTELSNLFEEAGFRNYKFYYPFPNYVFPTEIHTAESLKYFNYGEKFFSTEYESPELFDLRYFSQTLQKESNIEVFANSFMVEASKGKLSRVLYYKPFLEEVTHKKGYVIYESDKKDAFIQDIDVSSKSGIDKMALNNSLSFNFEDIDINIYFSSYGKLPSFIRLQEKMQQIIDSCVVGTYTEDVCNVIGNYWYRISNAIRRLKSIDTKAAVKCSAAFSRVIFLMDKIYLSDNDEITIFWPPETLHFISQNTDFVIWKLIYNWYLNHILIRRSYRKYIPISAIYKACGIKDNVLEIFGNKSQILDDISSDLKDIVCHSYAKYEIGLAEPERVLSLGTPIMDENKKYEQTDRRQTTLLYEHELLKKIRK